VGGVRTGYLYVETSDSHPGLARVVATDLPPRLSPAAEHLDPRVRYLARFDDLDAGRMHAHTALRRRLVDIEADLYRVQAIDAIAAVEASGLRHERLYLDPLLANEPQLHASIARRLARQQRSDRVWAAVGVVGAVLLILLVLLKLYAGL